MATATRNRNAVSRRRNTPVKLTQRGIAAVAMGVAGLVWLASQGHAGIALLIGFPLYLLLTGRVAAATALLPTPLQVLRGACWAVVALAAVISSQGTTAPGGATLGLMLAAATATVLRCTRSK